MKQLTLIFTLALTLSLISAPVRDDIAAKGIEYIGQEQIVPVAYLEATGGQHTDTRVFKHRLLPFDFDDYEAQMKSADAPLPIWFSALKKEAEDRQIGFR